MTATYTADRFGHYGRHGLSSRMGSGVGKVVSSRGPPGIGFHLTPDGNYDVKGKRITGVGNGEFDSDAANMRQMRAVGALVDFNHKLVAELFPKNFPIYLEQYLEKHKQDKLLPIFKETISSEIGKDFGSYLQKHLVENSENIEGAWKSALTRMIDDRLKDLDKSLTTKVTTHINKTVDEKLKKDLRKIKKEAEDELKAVTDMTRAFVYKMTSPGHSRNSDSQEEDIRRKLKEKDSTWRHAFPEVELKRAP